MGHVVCRLFSNVEKEHGVVRQKGQDSMGLRHTYVHTTVEFWPQAPTPRARPCKNEVQP